jgi:hypothetical protein
MASISAAAFAALDSTCTALDAAAAKREGAEKRH